jgi:CAAX protease family protein
VFGGRSVSLTLPQLVYTFFFGFIMYLTLRLTGNLIWPILLHASTDPTAFLFQRFPGEESWVTLVAVLNNYIVSAVGAVLFIVFLIVHRHDRVKDKLTAGTV